ncbi:MAG: hypothetical protein OEL87_03420 [Nanoarchaeota archaeon]|nr:hypothetical protein [Nanoarchaeota archaeon]
MSQTHIGGTSLRELSDLANNIFHSGFDPRIVSELLRIAEIDYSHHWPSLTALGLAKADIACNEGVDGTVIQKRISDAVTNKIGFYVSTPLVPPTQQSAQNQLGVRDYNQGKANLSAFNDPLPEGYFCERQ